MNKLAKSMPDFDELPLSIALQRDLRSDHAGECGAVMIYCGVLAVSRDPAARRFARRHLRAEVRHRRFFDRWLPTAYKSRLLPVWRAAGWLLGASAAMVGPSAVYRTVAAVEAFVERHYGDQIEAMTPNSEFAPLVLMLEKFCAEEVHHREDADSRLNAQGGALAQLWTRTVGIGSTLGVFVARRL